MVDKATKNQMDRKKMFYTMNQKTPKIIQTTKKSKIHHDNFRQSQLTNFNRLIIKYTSHNR